MHDHSASTINMTKALPKPDIIYFMAYMTTFLLYVTHRDLNSGHWLNPNVYSQSTSDMIPRAVIIS